MVEQLFVSMKENVMKVLYDCLKLVLEIHVGSSQEILKMKEWAWA